MSDKHLVCKGATVYCMAFGGKVKIAFHSQVANPQPEETIGITKGNEGSN